MRSSLWMLFATVIITNPPPTTSRSRRQCFWEDKSTSICGVNPRVLDRSSSKTGEHSSQSIYKLSSSSTARPVEVSTLLGLNLNRSWMEKILECIWSEVAPSMARTGSSTATGASSVALWEETECTVCVFMLLNRKYACKCIEMETSYSISTLTVLGRFPIAMMRRAYLMAWKRQTFSGDGDEI